MNLLNGNLRPFLLFFSISLISLFFFENAAIDNASKYRPLANGWVSWYAELHLDPSLSLYEKIEKVIEADLTHGRFRPAFSYFSTISYALSPLVHDRSISEENRTYEKLVTGDLQLNNIILLTTLSIAFASLSVLTMRYSGSVLAALIPIVFLPLSPALTENLLQNYIDSQEIPLILWMSLWMVFLFTALNFSKRRIAQHSYFALSIIFLLLSLLAKETAIVITIPILFLAIVLFRKDPDRLCSIRERSYGIVTLIIGVAGTLGILTIVTLHKQGYSSAYYDFNLQEIFIAVEKLWICLSKFSLHHTYGFIIVGAAFLVILTRKKRTVNDLTANQHLTFAFFLLSLCYGSLFILVPWKPVLIKYVLPSVIFFSFLVAYSAGIVIYWIRERTTGIARFSAYILLIPFIALFMSQEGKAALERRHLFATANYGIHVLDEMVRAIDKEIQDSGKGQFNVFVGIEGGKPWKNHIEWSTLHLSRFLNLDLRYNIIDRQGDEVLQVLMPRGELTSYRYNSSQKSIFLSDSFADLEQRKFDIIFRGYLKNEEVKEEIVFGGNKYKKGEIVVKNKKRFALPPFMIVKYLPLADEL